MAKDSQISDFHMFSKERNFQIIIDIVLPIFRKRNSKMALPLDPMLSVFGSLFQNWSNAGYFTVSAFAR